MNSLILLYNNLAAASEKPINAYTRTTIIDHLSFRISNSRNGMLLDCAQVHGA